MTPEIVDALVRKYIRGASPEEREALEVATRADIARFVAIEREACAKLAEELPRLRRDDYPHYDGGVAADWIAAAIRERT